MILIADSGSTKTEWIVLDNDKNTRNFFTSGFNPYYFKQDEIERILTRELPSDLNYPEINKIFYYGSGCSTEYNISIVQNAFESVFETTDITIYHDLLAAVHALLGRNAGIACILGTGSNSCAYDGEKIVQQVPSLGYLLGDEGSATAIGKKLITAIIYKEAPEALVNAFHKTYNLSLGQILDAIYRKEKPGVFLSGFSRFVGEHIYHPFCRNLVSEVFDDFIRVQLSKYDNYRTIPVSFTGSVAFHFSEILKERLAKQEIIMGKILASPAEGLITFYTETM
jgi:glucosamine kinase